MHHLIVTGDETDYSFFVYDLINRQLYSKKSRQPELESRLLDQKRPTFRPFGISICNQNILIASNDIIGAFDRTTLEFIKILNVPAFTNTHQILNDNGTLFVCNASNDSIGIHNLETQQSKFLKFPELSIYDSIRTPLDAYELDTVHVNSLCKYNNSLYFCLHKKGNSSFGVLDLSSEKAIMLCDAGRGAHNIRIIDDKLYSLSTATGHLIEIDLISKEIISYPIVNPNLVFLRGMEIYGNQILIACSNLYNNPDPIISYLLIFNPENSIITPFMTLPEIKFITDIHLL